MSVDQFTEHLEFLGYEIMTFEDGTEAVVHKQKFTLLLFEENVGVTFVSVFKVNPEGKRHRLSFLESVNAFNEKASVCQCFVNQYHEIVFQGYYLGDYDRQRFGIFIEGLNSDHSWVFAEDVNLVSYSE